MTYLYACKTLSQQPAAPDNQHPATISSLLSIIAYYYYSCLSTVAAIVNIIVIAIIIIIFCHKHSFKRRRQQRKRSIRKTVTDLVGCTWIISSIRTTNPPSRYLSTASTIAKTSTQSLISSALRVHCVVGESVM
uniref:Uncharacterized protein n=1 Tax=Glossina pallidipes TaxID=7398 RepID=A0A1A9ZJI6_GLOPL